MRQYEEMDVENAVLCDLCQLPRQQGEFERQGAKRIAGQGSDRQGRFDYLVIQRPFQAIISMV
jgi:hypothetical protein